MDSSRLTPRAPKSIQPTARRRPGALAVRGDHSAFHRSVLRAAAGGATGALIAHLALALTGGSLVAAPLLFTVAVATGALAAVAARGRRWLRTATGAVMGAGGGALFTLALPWPPFAAALLGASTVPVLAPETTAQRKLATGVLAAILGGAGLFVGHVLLTWNPLGGWLPGPMTSALAGASAGLFFGLASAPKHLAPPADPVEQAFRSALAAKDGEIHGIVERAWTIYRALRAELQQRLDDPTARTLTDRSREAVLRVLDIAGQCRQVDSDLAGTPVAQLDERIAELGRKIDAARDPSAQATYRDAMTSLQAQKEAVDRISLGRERIVARLHANVAILEKLRFSLIHLRNAHAERIGGEASPVVEALDELGRELDATASAVGEVFGGPPALPAETPLPSKSQAPAQTADQAAGQAAGQH